MWFEIEDGLQGVDERCVLMCVLGAGYAVVLLGVVVRNQLTSRQS